MDNLRLQASLIAGVLCLTYAASVSMRARKGREHYLYIGLTASLALWYLSSFGYGWLGLPLLHRLNLAFGVAVPFTAVRFFRAFVDDDNHHMRRLARLSLAGGCVLLFAILTPYYDHVVVATALLLYVFFFLFTALVTLSAGGRSATSHWQRARLRFLAILGGVGGLFTLLEYLPMVGLNVPPVGTVLVLIFLYVLSQSLFRYRLIDVYEVSARLGVLTVLSFILGGLLWGLSKLSGQLFFLHTVAATVVVMLLFDPLRDKVRAWITQVGFRERYDLDLQLKALRRRLAHALEVPELSARLMEGLEHTRRFTDAGLYLADPDLTSYSLAGHLGPTPPERLELGPARPLLDRLSSRGSVALDVTNRELKEASQRGERREAETLYDVVHTMEAMHATLCVPIRSDDPMLAGFLCLRDEHTHDGFTPDEVEMIEALGGQIAVSLENSRLFSRMKDRDRLAALGEMSAGLAHEIRNPLGAIKASAQYLTEPDTPVPPAQREFLDIIVEEVDRLNRVVSSFLDYARPSQECTDPVDVNAAVQRALQILGPECAEADVTLAASLDADVEPVRVDPERLRQVLFNLVQNAAQAMPDGGSTFIETHARIRQDAARRIRPWVEIRVVDTGPGIPEEVRNKLFVPFVTTKQRGTGLGLAITQRIVNAAGGSIEVRSEPGNGATFVIYLPCAVDAAAASEEAGEAPLPARDAGEAPAEPERGAPVVARERAMVRTTNR